MPHEIRLQGLRNRKSWAAATAELVPNCPLIAGLVAVTKHAQNLLLDCMQAAGAVSASGINGPITADDLLPLSRDASGPGPALPADDYDASRELQEELQEAAWAMDEGDFGVQARR